MIVLAFSNLGCSISNCVLVKTSHSVKPINEIRKYYVYLMFNYYIIQTLVII